MVGYGNYTDIARVNGSDCYKAFMLTPSEKWSPATGVSKNHCRSSRQMCADWPLNNVMTCNPLGPMIKELIAAANTKFDRKFDRMGISAYALEMNLDSAALYIDEALTEINATIWRAAPSWVSQKLIRAVEIEGNCSDEYYMYREGVPDPAITPVAWDIEYGLEMLVLAVDYTRDTLAAELLDEYCEEFEMPGKFHSTTLGYDAMQACRNTSTNATQCNDALKSGFESMFNGTNYGRRSINWVLMTGEKADDEHMNAALRQVLTDRFSNGDTVDFSTLKKLSDDPTYAGSRATAWWQVEGSRWTQIICGNQFFENGSIF